MLIARYKPVDMFKSLHLLPECPADIRGLMMDPLLFVLDQVLDDAKLRLLVWNDWGTRRPHCLETGHPSMPVEACCGCRPCVACTVGHTGRCRSKSKAV